MNGKNNDMVTATAASKVHKPHAKYRVHSPQTGTQARTIMLMIVARPMGKVPMNMD